MNWVASDDPRTKADLMSGQSVNTFPTKHIRIPVNKENVLEYGIVKPQNADEIVDEIIIELSGDIIYKNRLLMLDIIAGNDWKRPIYFTGGSFGDDDYLWMKDYLQLDGVAYKLVPIETPVNPRNPFDMGRIDADKMYDIVMNWYWGNSGDPDIYYDPETRKNAITYRSNLARLAEALINEGKLERAEDILDLGMEKMPVDHFGYYTLLEPFIQGYYEVGEKEKARELWQQVAQKYQENLTYYSSLELDRQFSRGSEIVTDIERYRALVDLLIVNDSEEIAREEADEFNRYLMLFQHFYGSPEASEELPSTEAELLPQEIRDSL
jgi:tetratricopeptide (TPR) repeat protein